mmetsp:Transcript_49843/g.79457  ORF Transcript_49843/g.79457 Transcript_49843/m.79457 type:complete len:320 (-) Transcript_49843:43-1002(-)|eukprot:CAMPEP_0197054926 /NCGR_PEP_ID=MMETSP1384-20130603/53198_1 /TAXON_ID=29189 /ORGANISM="Ammonia sp." /LENGTH=319 /DNA_ID=CAMNT_0042488293 /DNA_START=30 /DNA_END=989 /DNA_ORIENTATION=-
MDTLQKPTDLEQVTSDSVADDSSFALQTELQLNAPCPLKRSRCSKIGDFLIISVLVTVAGCIELTPPNKQYVPGYDDSNPIPNYKFAYPNLESSVSGVGVTLAVTLPSMLLLILDVIIFKLTDATFEWQGVFENMWLMFRMQYFCGSIALLSCNAIKLFVGNPRPMFLAIQAEHVHDKHALEDSRQSFVSGHSTMSMASLSLVTIMLFQAWRYTQSESYQSGNDKIPKTSNSYQYYLADFWNLSVFRMAPLMAILLIFAPVFIAMYIAGSRVVDYKHFTIDVVGGSILGACCAYLSYLVFRHETFVHVHWRLSSAAKDR